MHGRSNEAINRGGCMIRPKKCAESLGRDDAVREGGILAVRDSRLGQVPIAVVEIVEGAQTSEQDLKDFVRSQMPAYMVPTSIELVDALPRTLSMKVDRPALRALFQDKYHF